MTDEEYPGQRLHQYAIYDRDDSLTDLLYGAEKCNINAPDRVGRTPVYTAVSNNSIKCLRVLLDHGADPSISGGERVGRMTPLHQALVDGKMDAIVLLLDHGADLNQTDASGLSPINLAKNIGRPQFIQAFEAEDDKRKTAALSVVADLCAACERGDLEKVKSLLQLPSPTGWELANMSSPQDAQKTPLTVAAEGGHAEIMSELLTTVTNLKHAPSVLHKAVEGEHLEVVKLLLKAFPECCSSEDDRNQTALHVACVAGCLPVVRCLLEWDYPAHLYRSLYNDTEGVQYRMVIPVNSTTTYGSTPLYLACENGNDAVVDYLLNFTIKGRNLDRRPSSGPRDLPSARSSVRSDQSSDSGGQESDQGRDVDYKPVQIDDVEERSEATGIQLSGGDESISYKPVKLKESSSFSTSCVYVAVKNGYHNIVSLLAERGTDLHITEKVDGVPCSALLLLAVKNADLLMVDKLLQHGVEDLANKALQEVCRHRPHFIPHLLKYKASEDRQFPINKHLMKKEYAQTFLSAERLENLPSTDPKYMSVFPTQAVSVRWQNLKVLSSVEPTWLNCVANIHNPLMTNVNARIPLFAITRIDVSYNSLTIMPTSLLQLPSLCYLNASNNQISEFPTLRNFCLDCKTLEELYVQNNRLKTVPDYVFSLPALRVVVVSGNELLYLPTTVWEAGNLALLDVSYNKLETLPAPIWSVGSDRQDEEANLESINLEDAAPESLKSTKTPTTPGTSLTIINKDVTVLRASHWVGKVDISDGAATMTDSKKKGLTSLKLGHNKIATFPEFLSCCCPQLEVLEMSHNMLTSLGGLAGYPKRLKTLDLSHNQIEAMTDWQEESPLKCFCPQEDITSSRHSLYSMSLTCGHRSHQRLDNLETLDLANNRLTSLALLSTKEFLSSLVTSQTNLQEKETATQTLQGKLLFPNLISLSVDMNRLSHLPDEIGEQKQLKIFTLKKNTELKELPLNLGLLENLQRIEVEMCPIAGPIQDVIKGAADRAQDITGFLRSVLEESEEYNCMSLMIVGSFNIGKTSLLEQLVKKGSSNSSRQHFNQRQDKSARGTTTDGKPLSTVGIDIGHLQLCDKSKQKRVDFRTWDFAGQKEYYATHQYFLSQRSLYLVVWNLTDGEPGVEGLRQWLVNIQAQAPGAPVIIVGTHLDEITGSRKKLFTADWEPSMRNLVKERYARVDSGTVGLPRIIDVINVSADKKKPINIDKLKATIHEKVFGLNHPGRRSEKLLGHKVPKKYIKLQQCIGKIVRDRKEKGKEPVLDTNNYLLTVMDEMSKQDCSTNFRNKEDLYQATRFLHENGVLCHFKDTALKDQYFLDPQWLCDQLAMVLSVQEVQQFSKQGVMRVSDLCRHYKNSDTIGRYILSLLNKFEVAVQFDSEHLLLPSLLPTHERLDPSGMREISLKRHGVANTPPDASFGFSMLRELGPPGSAANSGMYLVCTEATSNPAFSNTRLYLLTYFPSGFWPRLITRILADEGFSEAFDKLFMLPQDIYEKCGDLQRVKPTWRCWQTGLELVYLGNVILQVKEVRGDSEYAQGMCHYNQDQLTMQCFFEDSWSDLDVADSSVLEISFKADKLVFNFGFQDVANMHSFQSIDSKPVYHDEKAQASILAKVVEHIDSLLQDWFPELGESRFLQSCVGRYLITRVIPCPLCLQAEIRHQESSTSAWAFVAPGGHSNETDDPAAGSSLQQGMSFDPKQDSEEGGEQGQGKRMLCTFLVEKCIRNVLHGTDEICRVHGSVSPIWMPGEDGVNRILHVAPDAVFQDLDESFVVDDDALIVRESLGRGAFGTVSAGKLRRGEHAVFDVAVKVLYDPGTKDKRQQSSQMSLETVCASYVTARQEVSILQSVEHPNIVPLLGLARRPLALLLALAPRGALNSILEARHKDGLRLPTWVIKHIIIQTADALDYLHGRSIIYRDLKSDNILVWNFPGPSDLDPRHQVLVKLADYGISRAAMPGGAKGFGGTPPFIAPEILVSSGRETYTEKVDIFSMGMFMFEVTTCRQPLADINNPTVHVSHGGRPEITSEEAVSPSHLLDLMTLCWSQEAGSRPSAAQVRRIASSPQFCHLADTVVMETESNVLAACSVFLETHTSGQSVDESQVWIASQCGPNYFVEVLSYNLSNRCTSYKELLVDSKILSLCALRDKVWCLTMDSCLLVYNVSTWEQELSYELPLQMVAMVHAMVTHDDGGEGGGHLVLLLKEEGERGTSLLHTTGAGIQERVPDAVKINRSCYCAAVVNTGDRLKLWLGTTDGEILVRDLATLSDTEEKDDVVLTPFTPRSSSRQVICRFIVTATDSHLDNAVWTYYYPGSKVYQWNTETETVVNTLDCSTMIPSSDSYRVTKTKQFEANNYQVTAILPVDRYLYVSTTWGCVIVADLHSLKPLSVFRCHGDQEFYCKAILPLGPARHRPTSVTIKPNTDKTNTDKSNIEQRQPDSPQEESASKTLPAKHPDSKDSHLKEHSKEESAKVLYSRMEPTSKDKDHLSRTLSNKDKDLLSRTVSHAAQDTRTVYDRGVVTVGRGYLDIIRHVSGLEHESSVTQELPENWDGPGASGVKRDKKVRSRDSTFVLSWIAKHWEYY